MPPERRLAYAVLIQALQDARLGRRVDLAGLTPWAKMAEIPLAALAETIELAAAGHLLFFQTVTGNATSLSTRLAERRRRRRAAVEAMAQGRGSGSLPAG